MPTALETGREYFLTLEQQTRLATLLDRKFNIPFFKDHREPAIFLKFVQSIDRRMRDVVQDEILDAALKSDLQIENEIAEALKDNLVPHLADVLPFPPIPGILKRRILELAVDVVVSAMAALTTIDETIEDFLDDIIKKDLVDQN